MEAQISHKVMFHGFLLFWLISRIWEVLVVKIEFLRFWALFGIVGTIFGIILGVLISINIDIIVPFIESLFGVQFLSKEIYYISELPSKLLLSDVFTIGFMSLFLSIIATIYPSIRASKTEPAEALKYE